jgi:hypothetical protein
VEYFVPKTEILKIEIVSSTKVASSKNKLDTNCDLIVPYKFTETTLRILLGTIGIVEFR